MPAPTVSDASNVKAYSHGLSAGTVSKPADFTINTRMAGPGKLSLTIDGPTEAKIECFDRGGGGLFDARYWPTEPREYKTNILFDDRPIPHSPFRAQTKPGQDG
jgi:filamin